MIFEKKATTIEEQISLLKLRGMIIEDDNTALYSLQHISYYRLSGYWYPFQHDTRRHLFRSKTSFGKIINRYNFDKELRMVLFSAIESLEVSLRTKMTNIIATELSPWWFENASNFRDFNRHCELMQTIRRDVSKSKDSFILSHRKRYAKDNRNPPSWKTFEVLSLNTLSKLYDELNSSIASKRILANEYRSINNEYFSNWLQSISILRNICAHHGRLINRSFSVSPRIITATPHPWLSNPSQFINNKDLYIRICIIKYLLDAIGKGSHFKAILFTLFAQYPNINLSSFGFTSGWKKEPLWAQ